MSKKKGKKEKASVGMITIIEISYGSGNGKIIEMKINPEYSAMAEKLFLAIIRKRTNKKVKEK